MMGFYHVHANATLSCELDRIVTKRFLNEHQRQSQTIMLRCVDDAHVLRCFKGKPVSFMFLCD